ncbi:hypothetical protein [Actinospica robiniae]|uniref:hypothetical protein n=1 Tax=Actinospica robiniae TaxID=304901 RepID=UPI0004230D14|nr:hypothetical protein [Actinospica robiniae]
MTRLDGACPIPGLGWAFRIHTLHTSETDAPYLTGTWHHGGTQSTGPGCALWLALAARAGGEVDLALFADHEQISDTFAPVARYTGLAPGTWLRTAAPAIAAHPYVALEHTGTERANRHRAARAILAYLITRP